MIAVSDDGDYERNSLNTWRRMTNFCQNENRIPPQVPITLEIIRQMQERRRQLRALKERFGGGNG